MGMSRYLVLLSVSLSLPLVLSFLPVLRFYRNLRGLLFSLAAVLVVFGSWDVFAVWRGHWSFDPGAVMDMRILNLPLEEVLFFVVIPFCCIFTWEALFFISSRLKGRMR